MSDLKMNKEHITLPIGRSYSLCVMEGDRLTSRKPIVWSSDNYLVADVDKYGCVTAICEGWTTVTACIDDGSGDQVECVILVDNNHVLADSVNIYTDEIEVITGHEHKLAAYILPSNVSYNTVTWVSENESIATVKMNDEPYDGEPLNATVYGVSKGSTYVFAYADDASGAVDGCLVNVVGSSEGSSAEDSSTEDDTITITIDSDLSNLRAGTKVALKYTIKPNSNNKKVTFDVQSEGGMAYISNNYLVPTAAGNIRLTATIENYNISTSKTVTISQTNDEPIETESSKSNEKGVVSENYESDPIDVYSGAQVIKNDLLSLFGGQGLTFSAHYNSTKLVKGSMGTGWYHNFEKRLIMGDCAAQVYDNPSTYNSFTCDADSGKLVCTTFGKRGYVISENYDGQYPYVLDCNSQRQEYYDGEGRLGKIVDRHGFETVIRHLSDGLVITDKVSGKSIYTVSDSTGKIFAVHDGHGRQTTLSYDGDDLVSICDVNGNTISYCYDSNHRILCGTDAENIQFFENTYDSFGRIISQKDGINGSNPTEIQYLGNTRVSTNRNGCQSVRSYNSLGLLTSFTDENGNSKTYSYDSNGNLVSVTDAHNKKVKTVCNSFNKPLTLTDKNGNTTKYEYDSKGNVVKITYPNGSTESFKYNSRNQVVSHTDRRGTVTQYAYDGNGLPLSKKVGDKNAVKFNYENGLLISETDALGNETTYCYNDYGQPVVKTDALGNSTYYEYDKSGNVLRATDANGGVVSYTYDGNYNKTSFTDANGNTTYYSYNGNLKPTVTTLPDRNTIRYFYDGEDRLISTYDQLNNCTVTDYDSAGRVIAKHDAEGYATEYRYDAVGNVTSEVNQKGGTTVRTFDAAGNVLTVTDPKGNTTRNWYDGMHKCIRTVDALGGTTLYEYSAAGDLLSVTDALGNKQTFEYDDYGNKVKETDAKGSVKQYVYDANNNLTVTVDALRNVTTYTYDPCNRLVSMTNAENQTVSFEYDALGNKTSVTDAKGNTVRTLYDANGNVLSVTDAKGNTQTYYEYNEMNLAIAITNAVGNTTEYCYNKLGKTSCITDALGHSKQFLYDGRGNNIHVIDSLGNWSTASYDGFGNAQSVSGPTGETSYYTYDSMGRLISETNTMDNTVTYGYNELNRKSKFTNARGQVHKYTYDAMGHMRAHIKTEDAVSYTYDKNGNLLTVTDKNGTISREYDELNRVIKYTDTYGNTIGYGYDKIGNLITLTYPDGTAVKYTYDANNNLTSVTDWAGRTTTYSYDENNMVTRVVKPDGSVTTTTYDKAHRVTSSIERRSTGSLITGYKYTFDELGRISTENRLDNNVKYWYTYDRLSRITHKLTTDSYGNYISEEDYEYDYAGNIVTASLCCDEDRYVYDRNNRLSTYNGHSVFYDEDGNMLSYYRDGSTQRLNFDSSNRLTNALSAYYVYNAENIRIKSVYNGVETQYVYNTVAKLSQLLVRKTGTKITKYVYGLGLIGEEANDTFTTYHFDYRGSTVALTNIKGVITNKFAYDAYGRLIDGNVYATPFLYNGRDGVMTDDNGLYYMRARYYSPDLRRFVNADIVRGAISDGVSLNRYAYANGNPITNIDPLGLKPWYQEGWDWLVDKYKKYEHVIDPIVKPAVQVYNWGVDAFKYLTAEGYLDLAIDWTLGATKDNNGIYHIAQDSWQKNEIVGYNDFYDFAFDIGVRSTGYTVDSKNFIFETESGQKVVIWMWKGDYINLGSGAEVGIYKESPIDGHWYTATEYAMPMTLKLEEIDSGDIVFDYRPTEKQWWINGFNASEQNAYANNLDMTVTIDFTEFKDLYERFVISEDAKYWTFNGMKATYNWRK